MPGATPRLRVSADVRFSAPGEAVAVLAVRAADGGGQRVVDEEVVVEGAEREDAVGSALAGGLIRVRTAGGPVRLAYRATVEVDGASRRAPRSGPLPGPGDVAFDLLPWTLPSRYVPSDLLGATAQALFGTLPRTTALPGLVAGWVRGNLTYAPGESDALTGADESLLRRVGVCRDLAQVAIALLRGLGVPARMAAGYALDLEPPDFHALVEAHDGTAWRMLDATGLAPVETVVRAATGRDAADVAWATTLSGDLALEDVAVAVRAAGRT